MTMNFTVEDFKIINTNVPVIGRIIMRRNIIDNIQDVIFFRNAIFKNLEFLLKKHLHNNFLRYSSTADLENDEDINFAWNVKSLGGNPYYWISNAKDLEFIEYTEFFKISETSKLRGKFFANTFNL